MTMEQIEVEIKFFLTNMGSTRDRIVKLGAECRGRSFESNIRYEDAGKNLMKNRSLLRLRRDSKITLTHKSELPDRNHDFKIHRELEVEVSDFSTMNNILESIGFCKEQVYEKWRETFVLNGMVLCLDTMPFGDFLEIEGEGQHMKALSDKIGLLWDNRIRSSYIALFEEVKKELDLPFSDITFHNFKSVALAPSQFFNPEKCRPLT